MPLQILLTLVIGGIAAIALLLHLLGKSKLLRLDINSARAAWLRQFPDAPIDHILLAADGHAALITTAAGRGLLWSFGADTTARFLHNASFIDGDTKQTVRFHDFAAPRVRLHLTADERQRWQQQINGA